MTTARQEANTADRPELSSADKAQQAEQWVLDELAANGRSPSGAAVAREFGMSPRWGQARVTAACPVANGRAKPSAQRIGTAGSARRTVREEVAERASASTIGTDGPATLRIGPDAPAPASASRPAPPASTRAESAQNIGKASGSASASARPEVDEGAPSGQRVAWAGFVFGSVVSVLANVMDARIPKPPEGVDLATWTPPADWTPSIPAQFGAAVWPIALLLAVEVLSRVQWPDGPLWMVARFGGVGAVGLFAAVISYGHIHDVLTAWGYAWYAAAVGPLAVDGLMVVAGFALLAISHTRGEAAP